MAKRIIGYGSSPAMAEGERRLVLTLLRGLEVDLRKLTTLALFLSLCCPTVARRESGDSRDSRDSRDGGMLPFAMINVDWLDSRTRSPALS
jgi:hypothetical protein